MALEHSPIAAKVDEKWWNFLIDQLIKWSNDQWSNQLYTSSAVLTISTVTVLYAPSINVYITSYDQTYIAQTSKLSTCKNVTTHKLLSDF